jgi:hypothetical protein
MRHPETERLTARDRIAIALLPFTVPKLCATAVITEKDFASLLERRIAHMRKVEAGLIEPPKERTDVEIKPHLPPVHDRRYRRF